MTKTYFVTWNLDSLYEGGSRSPRLLAALEHLSQRIETLTKDLEANTDPALTIQELQEIELLIQEAESYVHCLLAQDVQDSEAYKLNDRITLMGASIQDLSDQLFLQLADLSDKDFKELLKNDRIHPVAFVLEERRNWIKQKLPLTQEKLITQLSVNGYTGWNNLYNSMLGHMKISYLEDHVPLTLTVEQLSNKFGHPERWVRQDAFKAWKAAWESHEDSFAQILNNIGGFRLKVYEERGWKSVLKEPLYGNRMQETTLEAMWDVISRNKAMLRPYLSKKAELLDIPQLSWYDLEAPLPSQSSSLISFDQAADMIIRQFTAFSPSMGGFAKHAFENRWIDAEDRPGKLPGGFCTQHPQSQQSRIFMTYSGTTANVFTLAHELGHAYHNFAVRHLPMLNQQYRMNVAETASTLAEMVLIDSMIKKSTNPQEKRSLLDNKLQRAVIFLMNIHARFLFELRFYEQRKRGMVIASELNRMMEDAQKEAFADMLKEWHPRFWASKGHFYATGAPFYNFPYTFGYLFSMGIYAQALESPEGFDERYNALLRDTGRMTVETLASKHLGVDLSKPQFWQEGLTLVERDIATFVSL